MTAILLTRLQHLKQNSADTTMSATSAATHAVFATTELLEQILSYLNVKDLSYAQFVSPKWQAVIQGSMALQKNMFLRAEKKGLCWHKPVDSWFSFLQDLRFIPAHDPGAVSDDDIRFGARINTLFFRMHPGGVEMVSRDTILRLKHNSPMAQQFLSQPPVTKVFVSVLGEKELVACDDITRKEGLRVMDVLSMVDEMESKRGYGLHLGQIHIFAYQIHWNKWSIMEESAFETDESANDG